MPLLEIRKLPDVPAWLGVWEIDARTLDDAWLLLPSADQAMLASIASPSRREQSAAARLALRAVYLQLGLRYSGYRYNLHRNPPYVSISHTATLAVAMVSHEQPCGIDIETPQDRISSLMPRFMNPTERQQFRLFEARWLWVAKEAGYKWGYLPGLSLQYGVQLDRMSNHHQALEAGQPLRLSLSHNNQLKGQTIVHLEQLHHLAMAYICAPHNQRMGD